MNLFTINHELENALSTAISEEGEIVNENALELFESLKLQKDEMILDLACQVKNEQAEVEALAQTIKHLQERKKFAENRAERTESYIRIFLPEGKKVKDGRVSISWRTSSSVNIDRVDIDKLPEQAIKIKKEPSKTAIKELLESGNEIDGAFIENKKNMIIK